MVLNVISVPLRYPGRLLPSADVLWRHAPTFTTLKAQMTAQDRLFLIPDTSAMLGSSFFHKVATIFQLPEIYDYEPLLGPRIFSYYTMLWQGEVLGGIETIQDASVRGGFRPRLLDLTAARWVVTSSKFNAAEWRIDLQPTTLAEDLRVYANTTALPRARYVPRIEVIPQPNMLLNRLAYEADDLAAVAFVEAPPVSTFTGEHGLPGPSATRFVVDEPEHLRITVDAPARGFLVLADAFYPGWVAAVNGAPVPIMQANYMFRLVEVPAGRSEVTFDYRPASVRIGALISAMTLGGLTVAMGLSRRWQQRRHQVARGTGARKVRKPFRSFPRCAAFYRAGGS